MFGYDAIVIVLALVSVALGLGIIIGRDRMRRGTEDELATAWRSYARSNKLSFVAAEGEWPSRSTPSIVGSTLAITAHREGESLATRLELKPKEAMLGRLVVTSEDDDDTDLARIQPEEMETSAIDHELRVYAAPASFAPTVLTKDVAKALSAFRMGTWVRLEYDRGRVSIEWRPGETNPARIDEARRLAARVAKVVNDAFAKGAPTAAAADEQAV
jgi:hypothetical protein